MELSEQFFKTFYTFTIQQPVQEQPQQIIQDIQIQEQPLQEQQPENNKIYPINITLSQNKEFIFASLSNRAIGIYQIINNEIKQIHVIENAHEKKINQLLVEDNILYSCSNDSTIKLWDLNTFQLINTLRRPPHEIQSIAKSKHILAAGSDKDAILFWDLQKMKGRGQFDETLPNEVTSVVFNKEVGTALLGGSLDGMVALFDLTQPCEDEAANFVIKIDQPIDYVNFYGNSIRYAYAVSTANTISLLDMQESKVIKQINTINFNEYNQNYLISVYENQDGSLRYLLGKSNGDIEEYQIEEQKVLKKRITTNHGENIQVTCAAYLQNDILLTCGEDGSFNLIKETEHKYEQKTLIEMEEDDQYFESDVNNQNLNQESNMILDSQKQNRVNRGYASKKDRFNPF